MLKVAPGSSGDMSEDFDDVFEEKATSPALVNKKHCLGKSISYQPEIIHPLRELNKSLDSEEFQLQEPYKRRGSATRLEKRRPSTSIKSSSYVTFAEILSHFQNQDPMKMQRMLDEQNAKRGNGKILGIFSAHPRLPAGLDSEKDILLLMAETK